MCNLYSQLIKVFKNVSNNSRNQRKKYVEKSGTLDQTYLITGLNGAGISLRAKASQSNSSKNGCRFSSFASSSPPPNLCLGSFTRSLLIKSATSSSNAARKSDNNHINRFTLATVCVPSGIGGVVFKILLEISCWVFLSPSTVNGDAPVRSSYVNTPTDHQSTACNRFFYI